MVDTEIRLIIFFAAKDGEALYSQQKQDQELTVALTMNSLLPNSDQNWRKWRKLLDHSVSQFSSVTQSCPTLCDPMNRSMPGIPVLHPLTEVAQTHVHWVGDAIQSFYPLSSLSPPAFTLSQHQGLFQWFSSLPKYWSFSFSRSPFTEYSGLISFRMDWLDLLAVQGTLKSLLQHHSSKASILWRSSFFIVQLSHHTLPLEKP